jgi:hypothetical protein
VRNVQKTVRDAAQQQPDDGCVAARSHHDQIGSLLARDLRDNRRRGLIS